MNVNPFFLRSGYRLLWSNLILTFLLWANVAFSAGGNSDLPVDTNSISSDEIPKLHPPLPEIPPTFWERHQELVLFGAGAVIIAAVFSVWYFIRPKPPVLISPVVQARDALETLRGQPETGAILSRVSQVVRHYFGARFDLPPGELTTTEFCRAITGARTLGSDLAASVSEFLHLCDERKFALQPVLPPIGAVSQAAELIDQAESQQLASTNRSAGASPASFPTAKHVGENPGTQT